MSKRLASFKGPSAPTSSPVLQPTQPVIPPTSPSRLSETTCHRRLRTLLQELRSISQTWDDIVLVDGLREARTLVDARTELDNMLSLLPPDSEPRSEIVGPKLAIMDNSIAQLDAIAAKLQKLLRRMSTVLDNLEASYHEAQRTKGARWCQEEALWVSWPLEKFVKSMADVELPYHRSLALIKDIIDRLRSHSITFEASRDAISQWVEQPYLAEDGWEGKWEDLCAVEVERWDAK
ncbi:hypothetical protein EV363DRAFT_1272055 [Boletus edulis]|uniref:Uncharacterized protein n=1 Tax=Boletus edulis BED1 TaxID=1328754 RepID=A0AAD4BJ77_BOLED|nr:hypothetical protein EV363DRAFT_1272055 [Boletus edulis]KAF8418903.1 hypothetical protein L210DRAFT_3426667 [Boletus edulis BED1]KAF8432479.1 hypothetical protein L210DRAFT_3413858 [Boletus edulis BED1]